MDPAGGSWVKALILGAPDVGKTRSASFWPKPIFMDCEDGRMSLADRAVPYGRVRSTADANALINQLQFDMKRPAEKRKYLTLVIDTIDHYQKIAIGERLREEKKEALSGWADWGWLDGHMQQFIEKVLNLEMNIVMNCHYKTSTEGEDDAKKLVQSLRLKGDAKDWLLEEFDLIGMMETSYKAEKGERVRQRHIRWHNEPAYPLLKDRSGSLPQFTDIDFTDGDYQRIWDCLMSRVDDLPQSQDLEEIEVPDEVQPAPADLEGGPVEPEKLPEKRVAAKKTVAKKVAKKTAEAAPGEASIEDPSEKGTKAVPVVVDANKAVLTNYNHAHAKDGTCLKNRYGATCWNPKEEAQEAPSVDEKTSTDVPAKEVAPPSTSPSEDKSDKSEDPAVALVKEKLGAEELKESDLPERYCGKQPDSHKKFTAVQGCGKDLDSENLARVNLALLRAKTMLCPTCFETWKTAQQSA